jgi:hypothetical protein
METQGRKGIRTPAQAMQFLRRQAADRLIAAWTLSILIGLHWVHLRTTNPIESTFATVRHRTKGTKGPGSKAAGLAMAFKLIQAA